VSERVSTAWPATLAAATVAAAAAADDDDSQVCSLHTALCLSVSNETVQS